MQTLLAATTWTPQLIGITAGIGLVAGFLARAILPGRQHMNLILTLVLGVAGAYVGQFIHGWTGIGGETLLWQILFATGGGLVLLILLSLFGVFRR